MKKKTLYIISVILTIISICAFGCTAAIVEKYHWWPMLVAGIIMIAVFVWLCFVYFPNAEFICQKCNKQFKPTVGASMMGIHTITRRYLRCPHCNQRSWAKETWNFEKNDV